MILCLFKLSMLITIVQTLHYKGGTVTWKPVDPYTNSSTVEIIVTHSHSWTLFYLACDQTTINTLGPFFDYRNGLGAEIHCQSGTLVCAASGFLSITNRSYCTDFSTAVQSSSGSFIRKQRLNRNSNIIVGYVNGEWANEIKATAGGPPGGWRILTRIDLTQKYPINSSPVTGSLPIIRVIENQTAVIQIPAADWDPEDDIRCRWASNTGNAGDECVSICSNLPGAVLSASECTITWYAVRRQVDITANLASSTYVAAIMVEDFANTSSTVPMSSVPLQMLIFTYQPAVGACSIVPAVIGDRPNRACIGVPIGIQLVERIVAKVYCPGDTITEFLTTSPLYMTKTNIAPVAGKTDEWYITLTWTPTIDQKGPQVFCAAPIDQRGLTGRQHCINFVVGYAAPNLITPTLVQGSASPLGTVFANHSRFSIQATGGVYHPNRNGTYIQIFDRANPSTPVWEVDCGYSPYCVYSGTTVLFLVQNANWTFGAHYYILFSSGAASGNIFCAPESAPITDPNFWNFNIWDPGMSSTTTTTSTPPTTATVTTRPMLTTTPIANLTTTGIVVTPGTTVTTTTVTTVTTVTTTSVTPGGAVTTVTEMDVLSAIEIVEQCKLPVAIGNATNMVAMMIVHAVGMFVLFTKIEKMWNPVRLAAKLRQQNMVARRNKTRRVW